MKRTLTLGVFLITSILAPSAVHAEEPDNRMVDPAVTELQKQLRHPSTLPPRFWDQVAVCESSRDGKTPNWQDKGQWAGGLGIYVGTWRAYGGRQFAPTPDKATRIEQIVVANRISVFGFQTQNEYRTLADRHANRPFFRPKVGFMGWGCIRNRPYMHPKRWVHKNGR